MKNLYFTDALIIPCYNESQRLNKSEFLKFARENRRSLMLFVNDGSTDNTHEVLSELVEHEENMKILNLQKNMGKAEAVRNGALYILSHTNAEQIAFLDADLSTDFNDISELINISKNEMPNSNIVLGSRINKNENEIQKKKIRSVISLIINFFIRMIIGLNIKDTQCGAKVFSRRAAQHVFKAEFLSRWLFDIEIIMRYKKLIGVNQIHNHMEEIALSKWVHHDDSKISMKDSLKIPFELQRINQKYNWKPKMIEFSKVIKDEISEISGLEHVRALEDLQF